ncbi:helix-turn-helix domain-containing protein [Robbsia andropogonis]|uniref:helix-turn-helix domain-containing protein n=1 Tax=Robbsia andropogonis TaxID=28092 RepID=UPI0006962BB8|nr:helix-turn-helix transcriptional regulator [Robbsia andropogonis]
MQLSERIQLILDEQRLDQPALAKIAGVTKATVNQWISGKIKSIKLEYAAPIEARFGYSAVWLVLGTGAARPSAWPFKAVTRADFDALPAPLREEIEHHIEFVVHRQRTELERQRHNAA